MELEDEDVWGETHDAQFGERGRNWGAFEISHFEFDVSGPEDEEKDSAGHSHHGPKHHHAPVGHAASGKRTGKHKEPTLGSFTVSKFVDKGSPDMFVSCCKKKKIKWAIISIRETGEQNRQPFLVLEFQGVTVASFKWDLTPGDPEGAASMETITFNYETVLIKYSRQDPSGIHQPVKVKGWNKKKNDDDVDPLPFNQGPLRTGRAGR
jgi:type VI secretion system secreted protein Hcp